MSWLALALALTGSVDAAPRLQPQLAHAGPVTDLAVSPDGAQALSASLDGTLRLWDLETGAVLRVYVGAGNMPVASVAWTADGPLWCDVSGAVSWASWDGALAQAPRDPGAGVCKDIEQSDAGVLVLSDGSVELLDLEGGTRRRAGAPRGEGALAVHGERAWTLGEDGVLRAWALPSLTEQGSWALGPAERVALAVAPSGGRVAAALQRDGEAVDLIVLGADGEVEQQESLEGAILAMSWTELGLSTLTRAGPRGEVRRALPPGPSTSVPLPTSDQPYAMRLSPSGELLLMGTLKGAVEAWELDPAGDHSRQIGRLPRSPRGTLELSSDGRYALYVDRPDVAPLAWDVQEGRVACAASSPRPAVAMAVSRDGRVAASLDKEGVVQLWDAEAGAWLGAAAQLPAYVDAIALSADGRALAAAGRDEVWWLPLGGPTHDYPAPLARVPGRGWSLDVSPDGERLLVGYRNQGAALVSLGDGALLLQIEEPADWEAEVALFSEDGEVLILASSRRARVYRASDGERLGEAPVGLLLDPEGGALSADGARRLTGSLEWVDVKPEGLITALAGVRWSPSRLALSRPEAGSGGLGSTTSAGDKLGVGVSGAALLAAGGRRAFVSGDAASAWVDLDARALLGRWDHHVATGAGLLGADELLTLSRSGHIERWRVSDCSVLERRSLELDAAGPERRAGELLSVEPLSRRLVTEWRQTLYVWDADTGALILAFPWEASAQVSEARLSAGGRSLVAVGSDRRAQVVDVETGVAKPAWTRTDSGAASELYVSPDGYRVVVDCGVHAADSGALLLPLEWCASGGGDSRVLPDGQRAVSGVRQELRVLSLKSGASLAEIVLPERPKGIAAGQTQLVWTTDDGALSVTPLEPPARRRFRSDAGAGLVQGIDITGDGSALLSVHEDGLLRIWDLDEVRLKATWAPPADALGPAALIREGRVIALAYEPAQGPDTVALYDLQRGRVIAAHEALGVTSAPLAFAPDGQRYAHVSYADAAALARGRASLELRDVETGAVLAAHEVPMGVLGLRWSEGGQLAVQGVGALVVVAPDGADARWVETTVPSLLWFEGERLRWIEGLRMHELLPGGEPQALSLRLAQPAPAWVVGPYAIAQPGWQLSWIPVSALDATLAGATPTPLPSHGFEAVGDATADGRLLVTGGRDGLVRVHRPETGDSVVLMADGEDWIVATADGWFDASRMGGRLLAVVEDGRALPIDRYAATRNRPDLLLERLGTGDPALIAHFRSVALGRLAALGAPSEALGAPPKLSLIEARVEEGEGVLRWSAQPGDAALATLLVRADGVPVARRALEIGEGEVRLPLLEGVNQLELVALDAAGVASLPLRVSLSGPAAPPGRLFVFTMGVSDYKDDRLDLQFAAKDARDLAAALAEMGGYAEVVTRSWTDAEVTPEAFDALEALLRETAPQDSVVLFFSGHGTWSRGADARYFYLPHGVNLRDVEGSAVPFERLEGLLADAPARRRLLLLDTCESGRRDPDAGPPPAPPAGATARSAPALSQARGGGGRRASRPSGRPDRGRFVYNDIARSTGAVVFSSSRGDERSYERADLRNGVFTEHLLEGLAPEVADSDRDGQLSFIELSSFVSAAVAEDTAGLQNPSVDWDNPEGRLELSVVPGVEALIEADQR